MRARQSVGTHTVDHLYRDKTTLRSSIECSEMELWHAFGPDVVVFGIQNFLKYVMADSPLAAKKPRSCAMAMMRFVQRARNGFSLVLLCWQYGHCR